MISLIGQKIMKTEARERSYLGLGWFIALLAFGLFSKTFYLDFVNSDLSPEMRDSISRFLPGYVALCLLVSCIIVFACLRLFPKYITLATALATALVLSGGAAHVKLIREAEVQQVNVEESNLAADEILLLRDVSPEDLKQAVKEYRDRVYVRMFGEEIMSRSSTKVGVK
jgi:hypothetical protein